MCHFKVKRDARVFPQNVLISTHNELVCESLKGGWNRIFEQMWETSVLYGKIRVIRVPCCYMGDYCNNKCFFFVIKKFLWFIFICLYINIKLLLK